MRTRFFDTSEERRIANYARVITSEIAGLEKEFQGVPLDLRVAFLLPPHDKGFLEEMRRHSEGAFSEMDGPKSERKYALITAETYAKYGRRGKGHLLQRLVIATVDEFDGLESLVVFGVHLDGPTGKLVSRSWIYRAITRAQMRFILVNENVEGGWLEWLHFVQLDANKDFDVEAERDAILASGDRKLKQAVENPAPALSTNGDVDLKQDSTMNVAMRSLIDMGLSSGFTEEKIMACIRAASNDPDRAAEYLMNGIPPPPLTSTPESSSAASERTEVQGGPNFLHQL